VKTILGIRVTDSLKPIKIIRATESMTPIWGERVKTNLKPTICYDTITACDQQTNFRNQYNSHYCYTTDDNTIGRENILITEILQDIKYTYYTHFFVNNNKIHNIIMIATIISLVSVGYFADNEAFAAAGTEYTPTQPNALSSYNNATNQIQISWNFDRMDAGDKCVIKMDIEYQARATVDEVPRVNTPHYIPNHYSAISSSPTLLGNSGSYAEQVDCENASFRIDMDTIMNSPLNPDNLDNVLMFLTFYATDDLTKISLQEVDRIDEVFVVYSPKEVLLPIHYLNHYSL